MEEGRGGQTGGILLKCFFFFSAKEILWLHDGLGSAKTIRSFHYFRFSFIWSQLLDVYSTYLYNLSNSIIKAFLPYLYNIAP